MRYELRATCSSEINSMLLGTIGRDLLNAATGDELLAYIKSVAIVIMHKEVHRQNFTKLQQSDNESITHYIARLKSAPQLCDFSIANPTGATMVSFAEEMVATQLISGLQNQDHQSSLLKDADMLQSFKAMFDRLISLETTDKSTLRLANRESVASASAAMKSSYQKAKFQRGDGARSDGARNTSKDQQRRCDYCRRTTHPDGKSMSKSNCPAAGRTCNACGTLDHFANVCRKTAN